MSHILEPNIIDFFSGYGIIFGLCLLWNKAARKQLTYHRSVFLSLFSGYLLFTLLLSLQPFNGSVGLEGLYNFQPFRSVLLQLKTAEGHWTIMWHVAIPIPLMFFIGFAMRGRISLIGLCAIGFFASCMIETTLFLMNRIPEFPKHFFDVDDILMNMSGVLIGAISFRLLKRKKWMRQAISDVTS